MGNGDDDMAGIFKDKSNIAELVGQFKERLMENAPPAPAATTVNIDLQSVFVAMVTVALCVGKSTKEIVPSEVTRKAFTLANLLFKPDGTLND